MRKLVLIALLGCNATSGSTQTICGGTTPHDAALFAQLTANRWGACDSNNGLCLELMASGDYAWSHGFDDYFLNGEGRWNFHARDATSGLACWSDTSVIDFAVTPQGLVWDHVLLPAREPLAASGSRDDLDALEPNDLFMQLTEHAWAKTNEFDLFYQPTSFALARDGTFTGTFRDGACDVIGTFSVIYYDRGYELHPRAAPNLCDTRDGGRPADIAASNEMPYLAKDLIMFYASTYRDAAIVTEERRLAYSSYGGANDGLVVGATWQGALRANTMSTWNLTLENPTPRAQTITSITFALSTATGKTTLVDRTLQEVVAPGTSYTTTVDLTFGEPGQQSLLVDVKSFDSRQTYSNYRGLTIDL